MGKMPSYYRASCVNDEAAIRAFHSTTNLFDSVPELTGLALKRSGPDILFRFDDSTSVTLRLVDLLKQCGLFQNVTAIHAADFDSAISNAV